LIADHELETLRECLNRWLPADLADLIADLDSKEDVVAFECLGPDLAAETFGYLHRQAQETLIEVLPESEVARILHAMAAADRAALLEGFANVEVERLLTLLTPENQRVSRALLLYGIGTVGRLMTPDFIEVHEDWTVDEVLDHVRKVGKDSETLNTVYVTDTH